MKTRKVSTRTKGAKGSQLSSLLGKSFPMARGNQTKGGIKLGPSSNPATPLGGNYGGGMQSGIGAGYLGPQSPGVPVKRRKA